MKARWIEHKGKRIFYGDCTDFGYDVDAIKAEMDEALPEIRAQPKNSMLVIIDVRGTVGSREAMQVFKEYSVKTKPYQRKVAVIGITGYRKVLLDAVSFFSGRSMVPFNDLEQAKDWIVEED